MTARFHILVATDLTADSLDMLRSAPDAQVQVAAPALAALRAGLQGAHALIARDEINIDRALIAAAPRLQVIARVGTALSGIDVEAATARGIVVMNTPGTSAIAHAEHTLALMLALSRRLTSAHNSLRDGCWPQDRARQAGTQLYGKTAGVIGLGRVGSIVAQRCLAFGMTVLAADPYLSGEQTGDKRITLVGLRELLQRSDYITLHAPVTAETRGLLNAARIAQIKAGARVVNIAHSSLWDEAAVAEAVSAGRLAGAAVDVYAEEPPGGSPLIGLENVIHTPRSGDNTVEAAQDLSTQIVQQVLDALRGADYRNVVNMPFMPGVDFETTRPYLRLAECIGALLHTLARTPVRRLGVEYRGDAHGLVKPLTVALLKGLLTPVLSDQVNYINAPLLAAERGVQVAQAKGLKTVDYNNVVAAQVTLEDGEEILIAGTLLDRRVPHIVLINKYALNFVPEGHLLIMGSYDQPGVIGRLGTLLAENQINIASWHTGRVQPGGSTLTVLALDTPLSDELLDTLRQQDYVRHAHLVFI